MKSNDHPIVAELLDHRAAELAAGRTPTRIDLSHDQHRRLKAFCEATDLRINAPDGTKVHLRGVKYEEGIIFGLRYDPQ